MHRISAAGKLLIDHAIPNVDMHCTSLLGQILIDDIAHVACDADASFSMAREGCIPWVPE